MAVNEEAGERNGLINNPEERIRKRAVQISSFIMTEPAGYFNSIHLIKNAEVVVIDKIRDVWNFSPLR